MLCDCYPCFNPLKGTQNSYLQSLTVFFMFHGDLGHTHMLLLKTLLLLELSRAVSSPAPDHGDGVSIGVSSSTRSDTFAKRTPAKTSDTERKAAIASTKTVGASLPASYR